MHRVLFFIFVFLSEFNLAFSQTCVPPLGYYCPAADGLPELCPAGTYSDTAGQPCQNCANMTASSIDRLACNVCPPATFYQVQNPTGPNFNTQCVACPSGTSSLANSETCGACPIGHYADGNLGCKQCPPGSYSDVAGLSVCKACDAGTYTYNESGSGQFNALWGSTAVSQCIALPGAGQGLVCLPGTYKKGPVSCLPCPRGYYCPKMSNVDGDPEAVRKCPSASYSTLASGAMHVDQCTQPSLVDNVLQFNVCGLSVSDVAALGGKQVSSMTSSLDRNIVYFTTPTALYRLYLVQSNVVNSVELIAGHETLSGNIYDVHGSLARFADLHAIGVDMDVSGASIAVVADNNMIKLVDLYTKKVTLIGSYPSIGIIQRAGGVALRRNPLGRREAYVSDVTNNRIMVFNLENYESYLLTGDGISGAKGSTNGDGSVARFWEPRGLAFLERNMNTSNLLLVADSRNNLIRSIDLTTKVVSTWVQTYDKVQPEFLNPVALSVSSVLSATSPFDKPVVLVSDGSTKVKVVQFPTSDFNFKTISEIEVAASNPTIDSITFAFPVGAPVINGDKASFKQLVYLNNGASSKTIQSFVEVALSNTNVARGGGTGTGQCHLPCPNANCASLTTAQICGNSFLDEDSSEQCDNSVKSGGGCDEFCQIRPGFTCPVGHTRCVDPCVGYNYTFENQLYCESDCRVKTPRPGFTINEQCVETDIDECLEELHNCTSASSMCGNVPGSFYCVCGANHFGDGYQCNPTSYAVYAVVDVPDLPQSAFSLKLDLELLEAKQLMYANIKTAFAETLHSYMSASLQSQSSFTMNVLDLARIYTAISVDPNFVTSTRIEISTRFETFEMAQNAAASTVKSELNLALSKAIHGPAALTGASLVQDLKTRTSTASTMTSAQRIEGWGMNITSVSYNRSCVISSGIPEEQPRGGCWQVELIYMGGSAMPKSDDPAAILQSSKNVLYLPRIDKNPSENYKLLNPGQAFTMSTGARFSCDTAGSSAGGMGITLASTACCLRNFQQSYRANARLQAFLNSELYQGSVPSEYCDSTEFFNDTYPDSDIVFQDPENVHDGSTNDLVTGKIEGMPHSEVTLLETLDYTTRTFRVMMTLEEDDLKESGAIIEGNVGTEYSLIFFVGLANFKGMGGASGKSSVMSTKTTQYRINVTKNNVLTISSFGANQDPLVSNVDMALTRIKVTDFFEPVKYLYYLKPMFIMPSNFGSPDDAAGIVPISSIRVIKTRGTAIATDVNWRQACASDAGTHFWNSTSLQGLVSSAQRQSCVQSNLQVCTPPVNALQVVEFGIALPEGFLTEADFNEPNPFSIQVQFMINAKDGIALTNVRSMLSMAIELNPYGYSKMCETMKASQNLADVIQGNVYIGIATDSNEWTKNVLKKTNVDVPGTTPSNGFEFATVSVQGAVMTFAAIGDSKFFEDGRNQDQYVHIRDMHTVHFLEPLGGKGGPSPKFDASLALFHQGKAFIPKTDTVQRTTWLEPSNALLSLCPRKPTPTSKTCITRSDSTYKNNVLDRMNDTVVEVRTNDPTTVAKMQKMMGALMFEGAENEYSRQVGSDFHNQLVTQLNLNNRYKRAYSINPLVTWGVEAIQEAFPTATSYTVCTKIIAIGMVTIASGSGVPLGRRLLSFHSVDHQTNLFREFSKVHGKFLTNGVSNSLAASTISNGLREASEDEGVQDLSATKEQTSNAFLLNLDIPGKDTISQMCSLYLGVPYEKCGALKLDLKVNGDSALKTCQMYKDQSRDVFALTMENGFHNAFALQYQPSNIKGLSLLNFELSGCDELLQWYAAEQHKNDIHLNSRQLLSDNAIAVPQDKFVMFISHLLLSGSANSTSINVNTQKLTYLSTLFNSLATSSSVLGGGASIRTIHVTETTTGNGDVYLNVSLGVDGVSKPNSSVVDTLKPSLPGNLDGQNKDDMFVTDAYDKPELRKSSSVSKHALIPMLGVVSFNLFTAWSLACIFLS